MNCAVTVPTYTDADPSDSHVMTVTMFDNSALPAFIVFTPPSTLEVVSNTNANIGSYSVKFTVTDDDTTTAGANILSDTALKTI